MIIDFDNGAGDDDRSQGRWCARVSSKKGNRQPMIKIAKYIFIYVWSLKRVVVDASG